MIKQIDPKSIKKYIGYVLFTTHKTKDAFFEIQGKMPKIIAKFDNSLGNCIDQCVKNRAYPSGIFNVETIIENKVFRVTYSPEKIYMEEVKNFVQYLGL